MDQKTMQKLQNENEELRQVVIEKDIEIENLKLRINTLNRYIFGPKRESTPKEETIVDGTQCSIFGKVEDKELNEEIEEKTEEITVYKKKKSRKKRAGIKKSELKNVEEETIVIKIEEDEQVCPKCGAKLKKIGTKVIRQEIEYIPSKFKLKRYVQEIYKCEKCGTEESEKEKSTIVKTKVPKSLLSHSFATASLATEVIYQKYYMGVPLYRQEKVWDDRGLVLPRNMMAHWCIKLSQYYMEPIYKLMLKRIKEENAVLHGDETKMQCNKEPGRKASSNSYMWVVASGEDEKKKGVIFKYSPSRGADVAQKLFSGYKNILVTDGYASYNILENNVTHAKCWAHARRYFYDSVPLDNNKKMIKTSAGYTGVEYIDELFKIEEEIKELNIEEKVKIRQEKSAPILKKFYEWVSSTSQKYITNKKLKEALNYVLNQKEGLCKFLYDGRIPLTNSRAERTIRPFAIHRKNWLFADTMNGAEANAIWYSIIESAKANDLNIYKYINYLLEVLPQLEGWQTEEELEKYMPWSKELPEEVLNYQGTYRELTVA